jgi:hypothetical protein
VAGVVAELSESAEPLVPAIRRLVEAELADPTGTRRLGVEVPAGGDLVNDDAGRDELRAVARRLVGGS